MHGFIIPALDASESITSVIEGLKRELARHNLSAPILVIDDGSTDATGELARAAGAEVVRHEKNRGKGAALTTGMNWALRRGLRAVVSLDADGQHPANEAVRLLLLDVEEPCLVLAVRDLASAGAPLKNQRSNRFSNLVLSLFAGRRLEDTQCGLRRYPLPESLELGSPASGFAYESDLVLRAARRGFTIAHIKTNVIYPPEELRVTHFDSLRDPARIVARVVTTTLTTPHHRWSRRWFRRIVLLMILACTLLTFAHYVLRFVAHIAPPQVSLEGPPLEGIANRRRVGRAFAVRRQGLWEVYLTGTPEEIGWAHGKLLSDRMVKNETALYSELERQIPFSLFRTALMDLASFGFRNVDEGFTPTRRHELAAQALALAPDPFAQLFPTFQRLVYLNALYDISLSFEDSPLIGCTSFTVSAQRATNGSPLLGRAFDFEVDEIFDQDKAVFFVAEDGMIPFASVAWPGLIGVVSGMNVHGLAIVVHGARAGATRAEGEPVVHTVRRLLSVAKTTEEAVELLSGTQPMVSHLLILQDEQSDAVVVERAVDHPPTVRQLASLAAVSNHFEGPLHADPKNERVRQTTSTLERRARGDALIATAPRKVSPRQVLAWLRDRNAPDGTPLPPGDRRAIDADIATHGIITSSSAHKLWVSRGPHLGGEFIEFDLDEMFVQRDFSGVRASLPARAEDSDER